MVDSFILIMHPIWQAMYRKLSLISSQNEEAILVVLVVDLEGDGTSTVSPPERGQMMA
jgi:hypothetical protein